MKKPIEISEEQLKVYKRMEEGENLFITGNAGTGKSTLLRHFLLHTQRNCIVLAPTGVAAMNVGGATIHSFFKLSFGFLGLQTPKTLRNAKKLKHIDTVIIDEISMVRADVFDMVDRTLRHNLQNNLPFGGLQIIVLGDLLQLPPVVQQQEYPLFEDIYGGYYFFHAPGFTSAGFTTIQLNQIFRQKDVKFIELLSAIRNKNLSSAQLSLLNRQVNPTLPKSNQEVVILTARNFEADTINKNNLDSLPGKTKNYKGRLEGDFRENDVPSPVNLLLKIGAQVMITKNDSSEAKEYVNGSIGVITDLHDHEIEVDIEGKLVSITQEKWEQNRYEFDGTKNEWDTVVIGQYTQFPLKLAWAITIHKSQGKTFEKIYIDLGVRAFAHGQTYVALSRATTLEGLALKRPLHQSDIIIDPQIQEFLLSKH